jgi:hypothetical protein
VNGRRIAGHTLSFAAGCLVTAAAFHLARSGTEEKRLAPVTAATKEGGKTAGNPNPAPPAKAPASGAKKPPATPPREVPISGWTTSFFSVLPEDLRPVRIMDTALTPSYELTPIVARKLSLTPDEEAKANQLIQRVMAQAETEMRGRIKALPSPKEGIDRFRIGPAADRAAVLIKELSEGLQQIAGADRGTTLLNLFPLERYYCGLGMLEGTVDFTQRPNDTGFPMVMNYSYTDPETGADRFTSGGFLESQGKYFGKNMFKVE